MSQTTDHASASEARACSEKDCRGANRFIEVFRRLLLLSGTLASLVAMLYPAEALVRVQAVDFVQQQDRRPEYNQRATVQGPAWENFYRNASQTLQGKSTAMAENLSDGTGGYFLYLHPDQPPLNELTGRIGDANRLLMVGVTNGTQTAYLEVIFQRPSDFLWRAPSSLAFPWRRHAAWPFIAGLLCYALLPWHRRQAFEFQHARGKAVIFPDMLGIAMTTSFFALPILAVAMHDAYSGPVRLLNPFNEWAFIWLFCIVASSIWLTGLWYAMQSILLMSDRVRHVTLLGCHDCLYSQITAIEPATFSMPGWLRPLGLVLGMANPQTMGVMLATSCQQASGLAIRYGNGRTMKIWKNSMPEFRRILQGLAMAGVALPPGLDENGNDCQPAKATSGKGGKIAAGILLTLAIGGTLMLQYWPQPVGMPDQRLEFSAKALAQRSELTNEMMQLHRQMTLALNAVKSAQPDQRAGAISTQKELMKQYKKLVAQFDAIQPTEKR